MANGCTAAKRALDGRNLTLEEVLRVSVATVADSRGTGRATLGTIAQRSVPVPCVHCGGVKIGTGAWRASPPAASYRAVVDYSINGPVYGKYTRSATPGTSTRSASTQPDSG